MSVNDLGRWLRPFAWLAAGCLLATPVLAMPQDDEWEWSPDEGYHQEEWYDPTDWFNQDDQISYEYDSYGAYEPYVYDDYGNDYGDDWSYGYGYDYGSDSWGYGWHYQPYSSDFDYGWHYDELANDWEYGYYSDEYEYYGTDDWWTY